VRTTAVGHPCHPFCAAQPRSSSRPRLYAHRATRSNNLHVPLHLAAGPALCIAGLRIGASARPPVGGSAPSRSLSNNELHPMLCGGRREAKSTVRVAGGAFAVGCSVAMLSSTNGTKIASSWFVWSLDLPPPAPPAAITEYRSLPSTRLQPPRSPQRPTNATASTPAGCWSARPSQVTIGSC
jgi:hypothetical protein